MTRARVQVALRVRASPGRTFEVFTREIGNWWRPNGLFRFTAGRPGVLTFEPGEGGRLVERLTDGSEFEIGRITIWRPPTELAFGWRQESFDAGQETQVRVRFEPVGEETRITVEHFGWDTVPQEHAARHGFPLQIFQLRHGEWWRELLGSLDERLAAKAPKRSGP